MPTTCFLLVICLLTSLHVRRPVQAEPFLQPPDESPGICVAKPSESCCTDDLKVPVESIHVKFHVEKTDNEENPWNVTAAIEWSPPAENNSYAVEICTSVPPERVEDTDGLLKVSDILRNECRVTNFNLCPNENDFDTTTNQPFVVIGNLLFGYPYQIRIQAFKDGIYGLHVCQHFLQEVTSRIDNFSIFSPDCLKVTGNKTFCNQQPTVPSATVPRNVTLRLDRSPDPGYASLNITWVEPFFFNGQVQEYEVHIWNTEDDVSVYCNTDVPGDAHFLAVPSKTILLDSYYTIMIFVVVDLPRHLGGASARGNAEILDFNTSLSPAETRRPTDAVPLFTTLAIQPTSPSRMIQLGIELYIIIAVVVLLVFALLAALACRVLSSKKKKPEFAMRDVYSHHKREKPVVMPEFQEHEIHHIFDVKLGEPIGSGQFGEVFKANWNCKKGNRGEITVAVKTTKDNLSEPLKREFLDEIRVMVDIGKHPNIVALLGCRTIAEPYYLITEFMKYGSLKEYLDTSRDPEAALKDSNYDLTEFTQLQISLQISKGMEYLSSRKFIHGDLAARNILVGEELTVNISDFGLANDIYQTGYVRLPEESKRPVKWYSIEANREGKCTIEGDVWSFGVVLYEIYSRGLEPYLGMLPREVITRLAAGYRMDIPDDCNEEIYDVMLHCWESDPASRPSFSEIRKTFEKFLHEATKDNYFDPMAHHSDENDDEAGQEKGEGEVKKKKKEENKRRTNEKEKRMQENQKKQEVEREKAL